MIAQKRDIIDTLRRGLDNAIANWPATLLRLGEKVVFGALVIASAILVLVPIAISIGLHVPETQDDWVDLMRKFVEGWTLLLWILLGVSVLLFVFVAVHAFVEAGCARIAVDGDRAAGASVQGPRTRYRVFTMQRWLAGAVEGWWPVFWIYNLAWGVAALLLLIPLIPTAVLVLVFRDSQAGVIATGCGGLVITFLFFLVLAIAAALWTNRAIAEWAARRGTAREALRFAWSALKLDFARHVLIAVAIFVVAMAGSSFFSSFGAAATIGHTISQTAIVNFVMMPMRLAGWVLSSAFGAAVASWYLASYAALAVEGKP
ncbi:MAG TPA: hypothetical protein VJZ00_08810 [Thermoanaerobaculia bacterium]|nr:hypothetical protein [Thermoanaerobaculia bacterium]